MDDETLSQILHELKHIHALQEGEHSFASIVYPANGGLALVPAGVTLFDLERGTVYFDDGTKDNLLLSLETLRISSLSSVHIHPFNFQGFAVDIAHEQGWTGPFFLDKQHHTLTHMPMKKLRMYTRVAGVVFLEFGRHPEAPPVIPESIVNTEVWFADPTTADAWTGIVMRPVSINMVTGLSTIMSEALASRAPASLGGIVIETVFSRQVTWQIFNTGNNSLDYRIQGAILPVSARFITETSGTIAGGGSATVSVTTYFLRQRIQLKSAVGGASTSTEIIASSLYGA